MIDSKYTCARWTVSTSWSRGRGGRQDREHWCGEDGYKAGSVVAPRLGQLQGRRCVIARVSSASFAL